MIKKLTSVHEDDFDVYFESDVVEKNQISHSWKRWNKASSNIFHTPKWEFSGCKRWLKRLIRLVLLALLLWLLWRLFSRFNLWKRISTWVQDIFTTPVYSYIIDEEQKNQFSGTKNVQIVPIASWYYEIITKDENIVNDSIVSQNDVIFIPEPIIRSEWELCKNTDQYWHLWQRWLDYNGFIYEYINTNKKKDIVIAIIDSWLDPENETLQQHVFQNNQETSNWKDDDNNGYVDDMIWVNIPSWNGNIKDYNGHGTHIAWTIIQTFPYAKILPIKITEWTDDTVEEIAVIKWLKYAIDQKVDIINLSFWGTENNEVTAALIKEALKNNIIIIAAAWNESNDISLYYPANYDWILSVWSFGINKQISSFSNIGADNNMPGECIYSDVPGNQKEFMDGTSMSSPQLWWVLWAYLSLWYTLSPQENNIISTLNNWSKLINNVYVLNMPKFLGIEDQNNDFYKNIGNVNEFLITMGGKLTELQKNISDVWIKDIITFANNAWIPNNAQNIESIYKDLSINTGFGLVFKEQIDNYLRLLENSLNKDSIQLIANKNNILQSSLWIDSCIDIDSSNKKYCSSNDKQYWCDDSTYSNSICGMFSEIIKWGQQLPVSGSENYSTMNDYQTDILFPIYQWDNDIAGKNIKLWEITISGIPSKSKWQAGAIVYFDLDKYGYLSVTAVDQDNARNKIQTKIKSVSKESAITSTEDYQKIKNNIDNVLYETNFLLSEIQKFYKLDPNNYIHLIANQKESEAIETIKSEKINISEDNIQVSKVVDWDTINIILNGKKQSVRLIWVDAPESNTTRYGYEECFGDEANYFLTSLLWNQKVSLLYDETQWKYDKYDRLLAYIILNGQNVNKMIIERWYGFEYTYNEPYIFQTEFKSAEKQAKENWIGVRNYETCNWERTKK